MAAQSGRIVEKTTVADSRRSLRGVLEKEGNFVLDITRVAGSGFFSLQIGNFRRFKQQEFLTFNQEFSVLIQSGLAIVPALDAILEKDNPGELSQMLRDIRR